MTRSTAAIARAGIAGAIALLVFLAAGAARAEGAPTLVVVGAEGDLSTRKLLPALLQLEQQKLLSEGTRIIGFSRSRLGDARFRKEAGARVKELAPDVWKSGGYDRLASRLSYASGDLEKPDGLKELARKLERAESGAGGKPGPRVFYLAVPPQLVPTALQRLKEAHLLDPRGPPARVVIEKPFGSDLKSARSLNQRALKAAGQGNVFRIDHYLGKEGVQGLASLRARGRLESAWNRRYVERISVQAREKLGIEGRAQFYEQTGALRDMVQSHLLELVSLAAMDRPKGEGPEAIREARIRALESLRPLTGRDVDRKVVRAQYRAGEGGPGYTEEAARRSETETYVALETSLQAGSLAGVPILLETGKALEKKRTAVEVRFRRLPKRLARELGLPHDRPATLTISIDPETSMQLRSGKRTVRLDPQGRRRGKERKLEPYSRLLREALRGRPGMFLHPREVEASWRFVDRIRRGWKKGRSPLQSYARGSKGPRESNVRTRIRAARWKADRARRAAKKRSRRPPGRAARAR